MDAYDSFKEQCDFAGEKHVGIHNIHQRNKAFIHGVPNTNTDGFLKVPLGILVPSRIKIDKSDIVQACPNQVMDLSVLLLVVAQRRSQQLQTFINFLLSHKRIVTNDSAQPNTRTPVP